MARVAEMGDRLPLNAPGDAPGDAPTGLDAGGIDDQADLAAPPGGMRGRVARGVMINSGFQVGLAGLGLVRNLIIAAFLTASQFGLWGLLITTLVTLSWLKQIGVGDKYQQQDEPDQVVAFQKAFTLELFYSIFWWLLMLGILPVYAILYGHPEIIIPGFILTLALPLSALETPIWIAYRQMRFVRQRTLLSVDQVTATVTMIALAVAGMGYWSLVIGNVAGTAAGGIAAIATCPYPIRLRFDRGTLREYYSYSWPLFLSNASSLVVVQGSILLGNATVGLAGIGMIAMSGNFTKFISRVESIVKTTMYPAVCRTKDQKDKLLEAFVKSNLLGLMWAIPFGFGLALFAPDLVRFVLGDTWRPATPLLEIMGVSLALGTIGYSWYVIFSATGNTRPFAVSGALQVVTFAVGTVPLMLLIGLKGYAYGYLITVVVQLAMRAYYLDRLFDGFNMLRHIGRAVAPGIPAVAVVLAVRAVHGLEQSPGEAVAVLALYVTVSVAATIAFEYRFLAEMIAYLRGRPRPAVPAPAKRREALAG